MAFNITEFRAQMTLGGARANQFEVVLTGPGYANFPIEKMSFMCYSTSLPESQLGMIEKRYFGRQVKFAGDRAFNDWTTTVLNDEDFLIRNALERWSNGIAEYSTQSNLQRGNGASANPNSYVGEAIVKQYGKEGSVIKEYKLINCFPTLIGQIDVNWETIDTIEEYPVTWAFDRFESVGSTT